MALTPRARGAFAALPLALALVTPAAAWYGDERPVTEYSAETLRAGEWRLYLLGQLEYGITDDWELGTMPIADLIGAINLATKYTVWRDDTFAVALSAGFITFDPSGWLEALPEVRTWIVPVAAQASWRPAGADFSAHLGLHYTGLYTDGEIDLPDVYLNGVGKGGIINLIPTLEWQQSQSFAWVFQANISLAQRFVAQGQSRVETNDGRTTIDVYGDAELRTGVFEHANLTASAQWSWESLNLRLGLGYGSLEVPYAGVLVLGGSLVPEFNLSWRF
ncbi:MAG: hypothetical protein H6701_04975 [Myxococcales bacterium]|nr:hypothetical protein [Myxococcales bacterium]MCB9551783.1 hypothetical protein [Myxococcales bacterium]